MQILLINIVLSGDNAIVIALASRNLPQNDRQRAIWWGAFGAVALRIALTAVAITLLTFPYIKAGGAVLLVYIAIKLLADEGENSRVQEATTLGKAVFIIIVADFVMSLDNVLAVAAAADNNLKAIVIGIGLSIPLIIWGSSVITHMLTRFPFLVHIGAAILGYTAGEMLISDKATIDLFARTGILNTMMPYLLAIFVVLVGMAMGRFHHKK
ncbi:MAG: TerC family protein [Gorillibacterium sp.]|nr:TerC family protein [Gorillibacterium sp.]